MLAQGRRYGYEINTMVHQFRYQATADRYNVVGLVVMNSNTIQMHRNLCITASLNRNYANNIKASPMPRIGYLKKKIISSCKATLPTIEPFVERHQ